MIELCFFILNTCHVFMTGSGQSAEGSRLIMKTSAVIVKDLLPLSEISTVT